MEDLSIPFSNEETFHYRSVVRMLLYHARDRPDVFFVAQKKERRKWVLQQLQWRNFERWLATCAIQVILQILQLSWRNQLLAMDVARFGYSNFLAMLTGIPTMCIDVQRHVGFTCWMIRWPMEVAGRNVSYHFLHASQNCTVLCQHFLMECSSKHVLSLLWELQSNMCCWQAPRAQANLWTAKILENWNVWMAKFSGFNCMCDKAAVAYVKFQNMVTEGNSANWQKHLPWSYLSWALSLA